MALSNTDRRVELLKEHILGVPNHSCVEKEDFLFVYRKTNVKVSQKDEQTAQVESTEVQMLTLGVINLTTGGYLFDYEVCPSLQNVVDKYQQLKLAEVFG